MGVLTKEQILKVRDFKTELVEVPEWEGEVMLRVMTGKARSQIEEQIAAHNGECPVHEIRDQVLLNTICNEEGELLFTQEDLDGLGEKNGDVLNRLFMRATELNKVSTEAIEAEVKNSESGPSNDSDAG